MRKNQILEKLIRNSFRTCSLTTDYQMVIAILSHPINKYIVYQEETLLRAQLLYLQHEAAKVSLFPLDGRDAGPLLITPQYLHVLVIEASD